MYCSACKRIEIFKYSCSEKRVMLKKIILLCVVCIFVISGCTIDKTGKAYAGFADDIPPGYDDPSAIPLEDMEGEEIYTHGIPNFNAERLTPGVIEDLKRNFGLVECNTEFYMYYIELVGGRTVTFCMDEGGSSCGDGICDFDEEFSCPEDCTCGNLICELGEETTCPGDCTCGDGYCDVANGEDYALCPSDCANLCNGAPYDPTVQQCCDESVLCGTAEICVSAINSISGNAYCGECSGDGDTSSGECALLYGGSTSDALAFSCIGHICSINVAMEGASGCTGSQSQGTCYGSCFYQGPGGANDIRRLDCGWKSGGACGCVQ